MVIPATGTPNMQNQLRPTLSVGFRNRRLKARSGEKPTVSSSMKLSHAANDNLINRTHEVWQPRTRRNLTDEDARQISENVIGFFATLAEWSRAERPAAANDSTGSTAANDGEARYE